MATTARSERQAAGPQAPLFSGNYTTSMPMIIADIFPSADLWNMITRTRDVLAGSRDPDESPALRLRPERLCPEHLEEAAHLCRTR